MTVIYGLLGIGVGILYIKYNDQITKFTGSIGWAERAFGGAGTYTLHKLIGILIIIISLLSITGTFQLILGKTVGRLFP